jgi:hypothetical protein
MDSTQTTRTIHQQILAQSRDRCCSHLTTTPFTLQRSSTPNPEPHDGQDPSHSSSSHHTHPFARFRAGVDPQTSPKSGEVWRREKKVNKVSPDFAFAKQPILTSFSCLGILKMCLPRRQSPQERRCQNARPGPTTKKRPGKPFHLAFANSF